MIFLQLLLKGVHLLSIVGNQGILNQLNDVLVNAVLYYHISYMTFCLLGLIVHPFFYSILVRSFI